MAEHRNSVEALWLEFEKAAVPESGGTQQRQAMYMAFLAGCDTILQLELTVRDREASHRFRSALEGWKTFVENELRRISGERH